MFDYESTQLYLDSPELQAKEDPTINDFLEAADFPETSMEYINGRIDFVMKYSPKLRWGFDLAVSAICKHYQALKDKSKHKGGN